MARCTLYVDRFWISPYAFTAFVALEEKGVSFDVQEVSLGDGEHQEPEYLRRSVTGRVPMLVHVNWPKETLLRFVTTTLFTLQ